jgi:hypothetical protein
MDKVTLNQVIENEDEVLRLIANYRDCSAPVWNSIFRMSICNKKHRLLKALLERGFPVRRRVDEQHVLFLIN